MSRPVVLAACIGAACGVIGGVAGGWLVQRRPGGSGVASLQTELLSARAAHAEAVAAILGRLDAIERLVAPGVPAATDVTVLAGDVRALREALIRDLGQTESRLGEVERRLDELAALAALSPPPTRSAGPPDDEEESGWVNLASDSDPLRRFSALARLGRHRTDRSVRASMEALHDSAEIVVWQAVRNLGRFEERAAARQVVALLRHDSVSLRNVAWETLRRFGAPEQAFDPAAPAELRRAATEAIEAWAAEVE